MIHTLMIRLTRFTFVILFSFVAVAVQAQTNAYEEYINKYSDMAVEQMKQSRQYHIGSRAFGVGSRSQYVVP